MKRKFIGFLIAAAMLITLTACGNNSAAASTAESESSSNNNASAKAFPSFEGQDFEDNKADSSLFQNNAVTVVNFWFNGCNACVEELDKLSELNAALKEKGGEVIGINSDTFDGNKEAIAEAKKIMEKKGASYRNIWVSSSSDLANMTYGFIGYPITYVVDRNGNIVGEPIVGGINNEDLMKKLQQQIDTAIKQEK